MCILSVKQFDLSHHPIIPLQYPTESTDKTTTASDRTLHDLRSNYSGQSFEDVSSEQNQKLIKDLQTIKGQNIALATENTTLKHNIDELHKTQNQIFKTVMENKRMIQQLVNIKEEASQDSQKNQYKSTAPPPDSTELKLEASKENSKEQNKRILLEKAESKGDDFIEKPSVPLPLGTSPDVSHEVRSIEVVKSTMSMDLLCIHKCVYIGAENFYKRVIKSVSKTIFHSKN